MKFFFGTLTSIALSFLMISSGMAQSFGNSDFINQESTNTKIEDTTSSRNEDASAALPSENPLKTETPEISYNEVVSQDAALNQDASYDRILLFYEDFKISKSLGGNISCSMRLSVIPLTQNKLSNLSIQLIWPEIKTSTVFYNVAPETKSYHNISLLGEGCYSMDKVPNIVVNRCRLKGSSAEECAQKIIWAVKR